MSKLEFPDCLPEGSKTLDCFIFDYFNHAYPDEMAALIEEWGKQLKKPTTDETIGGENEKEK